MRDVVVDFPESAPASATLRPFLRWCTPRPVVSRAVYTSTFVSVLTAVSVFLAVSVLAHSIVYIPLFLFAVLWVVVVVGSYVSGIDTLAEQTRTMLVSDFPVALVGGCVLLFVWSRWLLLPALLAIFVVALFLSPVFALVEVMALLLCASASRMLRA
jgi:hypothetical protein